MSETSGKGTVLIPYRFTYRIQNDLEKFEDVITFDSTLSPCENYDLATFLLLYSTWKQTGTIHFKKNFQPPEVYKRIDVTAIFRKLKPKKADASDKDVSLPKLKRETFERIVVFNWMMKNSLFFITLGDQEQPNLMQTRNQAVFEDLLRSLGSVLPKELCIDESDLENFCSDH